MAKKHTTLRNQFSTRVVSVFLVITLISAVVQIYFLNKQIDYEVEKQSSIISQSINHGIRETDLAAKNIEHQIDLKIVANAKHIGDLLQTKNADEITTEKLNQIKEQLNLADISVFVQKEDDYVVVKSTDSNEIGFNLKPTGEMVMNASTAMMRDEEPVVPGAYVERSLLVLPILQSGVNANEFYKYAYFHPEGADYFINPYIAANEIYKFTEEVGPNTWIEKMKTENSSVIEIAVLDPQVFQNPKLEDEYWPPMKKIVYGNYTFQTEEDVSILKNMVKSPLKQSVVQNVNGEKVLKLFYPTENEKIIFIALDYKELTAPIVHHSIILFISGIISLMALLLLTVGFFSKVYEHIKKISNQIESLEEGDLTAHSEINEGSELGVLSETTNRMVDRLNKLVKETQEQATNTQRLSVLLEAEASQSVEKMYELSTEATLKSREQLHDISTFFDEVVKALLPYKEDKNVQPVVEKIELMREIANEQTAATTDMTITLSDLLRSLHGHTSELSDISNTLLGQIGKFKL